MSKAMLNISISGGKVIAKLKQVKGVNLHKPTEADIKLFAMLRVIDLMAKEINGEVQNVESSEVQAEPDCT